MYPASLNGLYAIKLGRNKASTDGIFRLSRGFDGVGVMARTSADLAALAESVMTPGLSTDLKGVLVSHVEEPNGPKLKVGVVPVGWGMPEDTVNRKWGLPSVVSFSSR